jgi:hypothetical protein
MYNTRSEEQQTKFNWCTDKDGSSWGGPAAGHLQPSITARQHVGASASREGAPVHHRRLRALLEWSRTTGDWEAGVVEQRAGVRPPPPSCRVLGSSLLDACGLWRSRQGPKMGRKIMTRGVPWFWDMKSLALERLLVYYVIIELYIFYMSSKTLNLAKILAKLLELLWPSKKEKTEKGKKR